jgi:7,8-dihydroneopterin 2',3'-cyclic phosphate phosphodiesterase
MVKAKASMKDVIELVNQIKNKNLREKTIKILKEPEISNPEIVYPKEKFEEIPSWPIGAHHSYEGGELDHSFSITKIALKLAEHLEGFYGMKPNRDFIISGALLHDIMKVFMMKKEGRGWGFTGTILDHADFSAAELYARGFPEEVVHIVAAHGGEQGASAANPRTIEAMLVFYADVIDAAAESMIHGAPSPLQMLLMGKEEKE